MFQTSRLTLFVLLTPCVDSHQGRECVGMCVRSFAMIAASILSSHRPRLTDTRQMASPRLSVLSTATYVSFFAQIGAASRIWIGELFAGNCSERQPNGDLSWMPCVAATGVDQGYGGALFRDLPANMLGCFIMGVLSSTTTLKSIFPALETTESPLAAISPNASSLQHNADLQVAQEASV